MGILQRTMVIFRRSNLDKIELWLKKKSISRRKQFKKRYQEVGLSWRTHQMQGRKGRYAIFPGREALDDPILEGKLALWSTLTHLPLALR